MEYQRDSEFETYLLDRIATKEFVERTGIHQSDLNYCLNKQALRKRLGNPLDRSAVLLFSLGWATQRWLTGKDEDEAPVVLDGITVTLDALWENIPWELKATYASSNHDPVENVAYVRQVMAQCKVTGVLNARLSRFAIMGDWSRKKESERPQLQAWMFTFTQGEIDRNWEWFVERRKMYETLLESSELLPRAVALPPGGLYECGYCSFKDKECK